jgi:hypothetical protein
MIAQLALFPEQPAPPPAGPSVFYCGGWKIIKVEDHPFGGEGESRQMYGWALHRIDGTDMRYAAWCPRALREMVATWARVAGLPEDLLAKGWQRYPAPHDHWLHWPENGVGCCRWPTLAQNIESARMFRPMSELRARAAAAQAAATPKKKTRRAA